MVNDAKWLEPYAKCYIRECVHQRSKQSHAPEEFNHIQILSDELLVEILCRLPCSKSATLCKCVCKHWASLISHPYFISRFIGFKVGCGFPSVENSASSSKGSIMIAKESCRSLRANGDYENGCTFGFEAMNIEKTKQLRAFVAVVCSSHPYDFLQPYRRSNRSFSILKRTTMMYLEDPVFNPKSFSFSSIPNAEDGNLTPIFVVGVCNDLFLYCRHDDIKYDYYICNVQTKEQLVLPSYVFDRLTYFLTAFICDPYYYYDYGVGNHRTSINLNPARRYAIVVVPCKRKPATKFKAHMLSSKTSSQWEEVVLSLPRRCHLRREDPEPGFGFGGMLHFVCIEGIIGFDPYDYNIDGVIQCQFISWPPDFRVKTGCVGVCQGYLQISNYSNDVTFSLWVLKDYKRGEWYLQHRITVQEWNTNDPLIATQLARTKFPGFVLGFHPTNSDVIYLNLYSGEFVLCNLPKRTLEVVSEADGFRRVFYSLFIMVPIMFPIWPTPLPNLA